MARKYPRWAAFSRFDGDFVAFSTKVVSPERVSRNLVNSYDCFIIGSDQVWNPTFPQSSDLDYLPMVPTGNKIAYAASFGVSDISVERDHTASLLNGVGAISVRESAGAKIVRDLTGREAPVVLDPTLLLSADDWGRVSRKPTRISCDKPYVFKYVLGNDVNNRAIEAMAARRELDVVDAMDLNLGLGPSEFVWLIAHSELVCTDSFHASVLALLHHKPLAVFERVSVEADMSSRFDTLFGSFGLKGHRSSEENFGDESVFGTDWNAFEVRLAELREGSLCWLEEALADVARG